MGGTRQGAGSRGAHSPPGDSAAPRSADREERGLTKPLTSAGPDVVPPAGACVFLKKSSEKKA